MKPVIEVTTNRYYHLILFPFGAAAAYFCFWASFVREEPFFDDDTGNLALIAFIFVGLLICFFSIKSFIANKPLFVVYEDGFVSNTHGVASHKVPWKEISRVEQQIISDSDDKPELVLVVFFKDQNYFPYTRSKLLGKAVNIASMGKAFSQGEFTDTQARMLIPGYVLGDKFDLIKDFIQKKLLPDTLMGGPSAGRNTTFTQ